MRSDAAPLPNLELLYSLGLSQRQIGALCGVSASTISARMRLEHIPAAVGRTVHGHTWKGGSGATPTYRSWKSMRERCGRPSAPNWDLYGGRGITIDSRWDLFENFLADMGERPAGTTLDRIDNDGSYEPGNCRWATASEQSFNRRRRAPRAPYHHTKSRAIIPRVCAYCGSAFMATTTAVYCSAHCRFERWQAAKGSS